MDWPLEGATIHGRILGGIPIMLVLCNFLRKLMVSNKKIHSGFENSYNSYEQYPLCIFTIYQNYTLALTDFFFHVKVIYSLICSGIIIRLHINHYAQLLE